MALVDEEWRREGRFWLPDSEEKGFGWIHFTPANGITVHLFESPFEESVMDAHRVDVLHGESLDGWPFTLLSGERLTPRPITLSNAHTADLYFEVIVHGPHVTSLTDVRGTAAHVGLHGLRDLLMGGGFGTPLLNVSADKECVEHRSVAMGWGELQLFAAGRQTKWSREETRIKVVAHAQMKFSEEVGLAVVDAAIEPLRDFIVFSTSRASYLTGLTVHGAAEPPDVHWQHRPEFKVIRPPDGGPVESNRARVPLMLNPATVPEGADIFASWAALREKLGAVWRLFFSTLVDRGLTPESQLLNLTAFAEGYHRTLHDSPPLASEDAMRAVEQMLGVLPDRQHRDVFSGALTYANSQSQRARIRWLTRRALEAHAAWDLDVAQFANQVADTRNWLTHWGERGKHVQEGEALSLLASRLYLVLATNLMLDLGLEETEVADQMATRLQLLGLP